MKFKKSKRKQVHMSLDEGLYNKLREQYGRDAGKVIDMLLKDFLDQTPRVTTSITPRVTPRVTTSITPRVTTSVIASVIARVTPRVKER